MRERLRNKRKYFLAAGAFLLIFLILQPLHYLIKNEAVSPASDYFTYYQNAGINIPSDLNFAGDSVPLKDFSVRQNLIKEILANTYWQSHSLLIHKRAHKWFPQIEAILKKNNIPDDFKYIAVVESNLSTNTSTRQASGYWQILENTGREYGLEINDEIDERNNLAKSTEAACKYFREAYKIFNDWTLVAASYNLGIGGIQKQLKKQSADSYYELLLNSETGKYIYRLLAAKEILSRPRAYGFNIKKREFSGIAPVYSIKVDTAINLAILATKAETDINIIKVFNPWIKGDYISNPDKKVYTITLPKKEFLKYSFDENGFYFSKDLPDNDSVKALVLDKKDDSSEVKALKKLAAEVKK